MPVTALIAPTIDGYIADPDGGVGFLDDFGGEDHGLAAFWDTIDAMLMGRGSYDFVAATGTWPYEDLPCVVLTHRPIEDAPASVTTRSGPLAPVIAEFGDKHVWAVGGGEVLSQLVAKKLLDTLRLSVIPRVIGEGIPLFASCMIDTAKLTPARTHQFADGIVELEYAFQ